MTLYRHFLHNWTRDFVLGFQQITCWKCTLALPSFVATYNFNPWWLPSQQLYSSTQSGHFSTMHRIFLVKACIIIQNKLLSLNSNICMYPS